MKRDWSQIIAAVLYLDQIEMSQLAFAPSFMRSLETHYDRLIRVPETQAISEALRVLTKEVQPEN